MPGRRTMRLVAAIILIAATAGRVEAGQRSRPGHVVLRSSHFHQRFSQARGDLVARSVYARGRHLGGPLHGPGLGGYGPWTGGSHGLGFGDAYYATYNPARCCDVVRPCDIVLYPYGGGYDYGYGYDGWITVGAEDYHRSAAPPVFEIVRPRGADATPTGAQPTRSDRAWRLLARGEGLKALREFAELALGATGDAEARAGYGLAAALVGKDDAAVWALRRAVAADAEVLQKLTRDGRITEPLRALLERYAGRIPREGGAPDGDRKRRGTDS